MAVSFAAEVECYALVSLYAGEAEEADEIEERSRVLLETSSTSSLQLISAANRSSRLPPED